jgi:hypothetical protein
VHGIQLGVQDVLYKKLSTSAKTILKGISNDENSSEGDDDNDEDTITDDDASITKDKKKKKMMMMMKTFPTGFKLR